MSVSYISQMIEIPHLGIEDCVHLSSVPKASGYQFTFGANGIMDDDTTRLKLNASGEWTITFANSDEIACCAANASTNSTTCDVYVYPMARITVPLRELNRTQTAFDPYNISINSIGEITRQVTIPSDERWKKGDGLWLDTTNLNKISKNFNALTNVSMGYSSYDGVVIPATSESPSSNTGYVPIYRIYNQKGYPEDKAIKEKKIKSGDGKFEIGGGARLFTDASGSRFPDISNVSIYKYGEFENEWAITRSPNTSANVVIQNSDFKHIYTSTKEYMMSLLKPQSCYLIPTFIENNLGVITINNRSALEYIHVPSMEGNSSTNPVSAAIFNYNYQIRNYRLLSTTNRDTNDTLDTFHTQLVQPKDWQINFIMDIPEINWSLVPGSIIPIDDIDPGPRILDESYKLILAGDYITTSYFNWQIHKQVTNVGTKTKVNGDIPIQKSYNIFSSSPYPIITNSDNKQAPVSFGAINESPNPIMQSGLDQVWHFCINSYDGGSGQGTMAFKYRIIRTFGGGANDYVVLQDWTDCTKTNWFNFHPTNAPEEYRIYYYKFTFDKSLSELGETDPNVPWQNYYVNVRQYYAGVDPYETYGYSWGQSETSVNLNSAGWVANPPYERAFEHPIPIDKQPYRLLTNNNDVITSLGNTGYYYDYHRPNVTWSGTATLETGNGPNGMKKFRIRCQKVPNCTNEDFYLATNNWTMTKFRIKRKSDGKFLYRLLSDSATLAEGNLWTPEGKQFQMNSRTDVVMGSGKYSGVAVDWRSPYFLLDKKPGMESSEEFEIELVNCLNFYFWGAPIVQIVCDEAYHMNTTID